MKHPQPGQVPRRSLEQLPRVGFSQVDKLAAVAGEQRGQRIDRKARGLLRVDLRHQLLPAGSSTHRCRVLGLPAPGPLTL